MQSLSQYFHVVLMLPSLTWQKKKKKKFTMCCLGKLRNSLMHNTERARTIWKEIAVPLQGFLINLLNYMSYSTIGEQ